MKNRIALLSMAVVFVAASLQSGWCAEKDSAPGGGPLTEKLKAAAANTWVEICREKTGYRTEAMYVYAPQLGKFVLSGGNIGISPHFDTELFDPAECKWSNAYPEGAPYKNVSGPTDAPRFTNTRGILKREKNGVLRIRIDTRVLAYDTDSATHRQWVWNPDNGKLYAHLIGVTMAWDGKTRAWKDLKAAPFKKGKRFGLQWASMCYDPVNKEILSIGGNSDEDAATPGSWVFEVAAGKWRKLTLGTPERNALRAKAKDAAVKVQDLVNAARNRYYLTDSEAESKADLTSRASKTAEMVKALAAEIKSSATDKAATEMAAAGFAEVATGLLEMTGELKAPTGPVLAKAQGLVHKADMAVHDLDVEPCGRAGAQIAYDAAQKKIVLFGGNRLDLRLSDTWVFDCTTRTWEQRYPTISPRPRSNHTMDYLPRSRKVVLAGGCPFEIWVYDTAKNEWKLVQHVPRAKVRLRYHERPYCQNTPRGGMGAIYGDDVLVWMGFDYVNPGDRKPSPRVTWACRVDPDAPDAGSAKFGTGPKTAYVVNRRIAPETYDQKAKLHTEKMAGMLKSMPANKWTRLPKPALGTGVRGWGTVPYDTRRHQFVTWGGGHSTYKWSDTAHYSLRTATWSTGYRAEQPLRGCFTVDALRFFSGRPQVPCHVWEAAAFDPPSGKVIFINQYAWIYNPARRDWDLPPVKTPFNASAIKVGMTATPRGAVALASGGLHLYQDESRSWKTLVPKGFPGSGSDSGGVCYDSKRDCLWIGYNKSTALICYNMKTGKRVSVKTNAKPGFIREVVYVPELDMLLSMNRKKAKGGTPVNLAFDIEKKKWVGLAIPFGDGKPHLPTHYWYYDRALAYDPLHKVALFYDRPATIWVLSLKQDGLKIVDL